MKTKASILAFFITLLSISCKEEGTKDNDKYTEKTIRDTLKNNTSIQKSEAAPASATEHNASNDVQNFSTDKNISLLVGSWDDVDPNDPGSGSQSITLTKDGNCRISEQEGGYEGHWSYEAAIGVLNLKLSHFNGSGVIDSEVDNDYKIEELTENRIKISDIENEYPRLSGFFWKSQN